jgi:metal-sulfur cluster biosynthetic enzyme
MLATLEHCLIKGNLHNALQDAIRQAVGVQNCYVKLKIRPR